MSMHTLKMKKSFLAVFGQDLVEGLVHRFHSVNSGLSLHDELDVPIHGPGLRHALGPGDGDQKLVSGRGEILHEVELGRRLCGELGKMLPVLQKGYLERPGSNLDNNMRRAGAGAC